MSPNVVFPSCKNARKYTSSRGSTGKANSASQTLKLHLSLSILKWNEQARREREKKGNFPQAPRRLKAPLLLKNMKYTRMRYFENQNSKKFSSGRPRENIFLRPRCGSRRPWD